MHIRPPCTTTTRHLYFAQLLLTWQGPGLLLCKHQLIAHEHPLFSCLIVVFFTIPMLSSLSELLAYFTAEMSYQDHICMCNGFSQVLISKTKSCPWVLSSCIIHRASPWSNNVRALEQKLLAMSLIEKLISSNIWQRSSLEEAKFNQSTTSLRSKFRTGTHFSVKTLEECVIKASQSKLSISFKFYYKDFPFFNSELNSLELFK